MSIIVQILLGLTLALTGPSASTAGHGFHGQPPVIAPLDTIQPHP